MTHSKNWLVLGATSLLLVSSTHSLSKSAIAAPTQVAQTTTQTQWKSFQGRGILLSLPSSFQGGSPSDAQAKAMIDGIKSLGDQFASIAQMVEKNPAIFALVAVDPNPNVSGGVTNVLVSTEQQVPNLTLQRYMDALARFLPDPIKVVSKDIVTVQGRPTGRLVTEAQVEGKGIKQTIYVMQQGNRIWTVAYSTGKEDYARLAPVFERSIQTFRTKPS